MARIVWKQGQEKTSLDAFLVQYPPSKTWNPAGGDGWIWVRSERSREVEAEGSQKSIEDAQKALSGLIERYKEIDENPKIPKVKSKTSGPSKRMLRESAAKDTERALRDCGKGYPCGKWLFFEKAGYVDAVFAKLARSIIDGPLSRLPNAKCHTIKAATADPQAGSSSSRGREQQWLICLYFDVVWNIDHAKEVLECVVNEHGQIPNSVKADLYTIIGLDSNHPSKLRSTLYRPTEIFNDEVLKGWQSEYFSQLKRKAGGGVDESGDKENKKRVITSNHGVPVRPEDFWPASDDEQDVSKESIEKAPTKTVEKETEYATEKPANVEPESKAAPIKVNDSDSDTEEEEEIISLAAPTIKKHITSSPDKTSSKHTSPEKDTTKPIEASPPIKHTTITPVIVKKRDRFGRSDF